MTFVTRLLLTVSALALFPAHALAADTDPKPATAAEESETPDSEVVVTATRRTTPLQKTPVSVGVIGGQDLQEQKLTTLRDLSSTVAGLNVPSASTPSLAYLFIRGIGTVSPTYNGAVGIYIDDVYQARIINSGVFGLPDVERVEVLRGPQGTLYGQNTSAGAIKIISKTPGDVTTGSASIAIGDYGQVNGSAYLSGPIIPDVLAASIAYSHEQTGGFTYNATLGHKVNRIHTDQGRVKFHLTPTGEDGLKADLSLYFLRDRSDNGTPSPLNVANPDPRVTYENLDLKIHNDAYLASLALSKDVSEGLTLRSITGYRAFDNSPDPWSQDGLATDLFSWQLNLHQKQFSQEGQLSGDFGPLTFTTGAVYFHEDFTADRPNVTLGNRGGAISKTVINSIGIYGQGHYAITPKLGMTLGLRYYSQHDTYDNSGYTSNAAFQRLNTTYTLTGLRQHSDGFTPKVGLDYQFADGVFGYASYTQGQKSGGYNPVASAATIAAIAIQPEKVTTYEAGLKLGRGTAPFQFNITGFYNDFRDYQSLLSNVVLNGTIINGSVAINAQKARTYGIEIETVARPLTGLELRAAATALDATFRKFNFTTVLGAAIYDGNRIPYTSKYTIGASAAYTIPVERVGDFKLRGEVKYSSDAYTDITNITHIPEQTYVNLDAQLTTLDRHWTLFARARNLLNDTYAIGGIPKTPVIPGVLATTYNAPRMVQVGASYSF